MRAGTNVPQHLIVSGMEKVPSKYVLDEQINECMKEQMKESRKNDRCS